jgi:PAS domain S-box-containing protein
MSPHVRALPIAAPPSNEPSPQGRMLAALLTQLPMGVIIADREGRFTLVNDAAAKLLGEHQLSHRPRESWVGPTPVFDSGPEPIHWIIGRVLLTGEVIRNEEVEYLDPRDEWRTLSVSATPLHDEEREISHALVTFSDVTATKRALEWEPLIRAISKL